MTSQLYKSFKTDHSLETEGVTFEIYDNRVKMARAGVANPAFQASMTKRTQVYRRQIARNEMAPEKELEILIEVYLDSIIMNWEVKKGDEWVQGIPSKDGDVLPYSRENLRRLLSDLPELFMELQTLASNAQHYREDDSKN